MSKQSLLLVDGDTRSLRVLEVSLRKAGFTVTTAVSVQDALDKLELHAPDLIISETTFPDGDGFELRRRVRATPDWGEIPFIFLTAENAIENKIRGLELGVDDYLTKPIYIKEIITRINILLQKRQRTRFEERRDGRTRFAGRVADMPVVDVIQTIEISRKSGVIQFVGDRGRQAAIYFRDGRVIDAEAGALQGADAVYRLLTWNEGEFEVMFRTVRRREVITMSSQGLLMEGMRRLDEWSRLLEQLPPLQHRFEVEVSELAIRLGDVPDEHNRILRLLDGKRTLLEVIDACDLGDLECLQAISRLYFEELLVDLDHGTPVRRETGRAIQIVDVSAPTPFEDAASGPVRRPRTDVTAAVEAAEAALAAAAAAMSRAESAIDVEAAGEPEPGELEVGEPEAGEPEAGEPEAGELEAGGLAPDEPGAEESLPGTLMGGYRPSSLRLIDEAVAAAQAIEPSLFEDEPGADGAHANGAGGNGVQPGADGAQAYADAERTTPPRPSGRRTTAPRFSVGSPAVGSAAVVTEAADSAAAASGAPSGELTAKPSGISARAGTAAPGVTGRTTTGELSARSGAAGDELSARGAGAVGDVVSGEEPARSGGASSSVIVGAPGGEVTARGVGVASGAAVGAASSVVVGAPGGEVTARGVGVASGAAGGTASELAARAGGASSGAAAGGSSSVVVGAPSGEVTVRGVGVASDSTAGGASGAAAGDASGEVAGRGAAVAGGAASTREAGVAAPGAGSSASIVLDAAAASGAVSASGRPSTGLVSGEIAPRGGAAATGAAEPAGAATGAPTLPRAASVTLPGTGAVGTPSTASAMAGAGAGAGAGAAAGAAAGAGAASGAAGLAASMARASADEAAAPALPRAITDPGLRMIGSLGRDRAEASGELVPAGSPPAPVSETQRELVTILPRRITREMQALPSVDPAISRAPTNPPIPAGDAAPASNTPPPVSGRASTSPGATERAATNPPVAEVDAAPVSGRASTSPGETKRASTSPGATGRASTSPGATGRAATSPEEAESSAVSVETPRERTSSRTPRPGSGVVRTSRAPGLGTIVLLALAALLAVTAVYLRLRRTSPAIDPVAVASDAAVADPSVSLPPDAAALPPEEPDAGAAALPSEEPDAGAPAGVTPDAAAPTPAADAAPVEDKAAPVEDKAAQAKALVEKANDAILEGAFERALRAADASLALRKTARGHLARAKALQRLDRVDDALAAIDAAEKMAPKYASVYELRGRILWAVRRREEARQQFERFLELEAEGPRAAQIQKLLAEPR